MVTGRGRSDTETRSPSSLILRAESLKDVQIRPCPGCGTAEFYIAFDEPPFRIVRCRKCSLVFLGNPPPEEALYEEYYSSEEPREDEYRIGSQNPRMRELFAINAQRIKRIHRLKPDGSLLDIGCGRGYFLRTATELGYRTYGIDVSEKAVAYAGRVFDVRADVRSMENLLETGEQFDVITLWHVLEHFVDPFAALRQIRQLLRPDGLCIVEVPNVRSMKFLLSRTKWEGGNHPLYHRTFFSAKTLQAALEDSGFSDVRRMRWSYDAPGMKRPYWYLKHGLNWIAMDAFLDVVAWNKKG